MKMKIDNFEQVEALLDFSEGTFYKFVLLIRQKDGDNNLLTEGSNKTTVLKTFYVDSWEYYWEKKEIMKKIARETGARVYMCTDKKDCAKLCISMMTELTKVFKSVIDGNSQAFRYIYKLIDSLTSKDEVSAKGSKMCMLDVDIKDEKVKEALTEWAMSKNSTPIVLESVNGYHIILKRNFDISKWKEDFKSNLNIDCAVMSYVNKGMVEIKHNAMCLVYVEIDSDNNRRSEGV